MTAALGCAIGDLYCPLFSEEGEEEALFHQQLHQAMRFKGRPGRHGGEEGSHACMAKVVESTADVQLHEDGSGCGDFHNGYHVVCGKEGLDWLTA